MINCFFPEKSKLINQAQGLKNIQFKDPISKNQFAIVPSLKIDNFLLHASRADEDGNIEILGPRALDTIMAGASKQVIVTVDEVVSRDILAREKKGSLISKNFIKAIAHALDNNPECNVTWGENRIIKSKSTDVALAIAINDGLITPVIKDIKNKNLSALSAETKSLIERSKNRRLKADELTGGTITISNLGMMGIDNFDAIINPPHGSILAVGKTQEVVCFDENEKVIKKTIIQLTLSVDHRMIDGAIGAKFLNEIASFLEEPINLLA